MSEYQFSRSFQLPDYLEDALAPFSWSGVLSTKFRSDVISVIMAANRVQAADRLIASLRLLKFIDKDWTEQLAGALERFAKEGFPKREPPK